MRVWVTILSCIVVVLLSVCSGLAQGVRPISMGGAFTGLADDVNAAFYNPAGLGTLRSSQAICMTSVGSSDWSTGLLAYALKPSAGAWAYGVTYQGYTIERGYYGRDMNESTYSASASYRLNRNAYLGSRVRGMDFGSSGAHSDLAIDLSMFHVFSERWSAGVVVSNLNRPVLRWGIISPYGDVTQTMETAICPGIAYRPNQSTVLAMDYDDITANGDFQRFSLGAEHILPNGVAVRAGLRHYAGNVLDTLTVGVGVPAGRTRVDLAMESNYIAETFYLGLSSQL